MICPICSRQVDSIASAIKKGKYVSERCERCLAMANISAVYARKYERDRQAEDFRRDLIQPIDERGNINREFVKEFPDQARQKFGDDIVKSF